MIKIKTYLQTANGWERVWLSGLCFSFLYSVAWYYFSTSEFPSKLLFDIFNQSIRPIFVGEAPYLVIALFFGFFVTLNLLIMSLLIRISFKWIYSGFKK
jgi:hypothetical protein